MIGEDNHAIGGLWSGSTTTAGAAWKSWASVPVSVLRRRVVVTKQLML